MEKWIEEGNASMGYDKAWLFSNAHDDKGPTRANTAYAKKMRKLFRSAEFLAVAVLTAGRLGGPIWS